jgi:flagellum-specific peptidoglycan hydrolase FlgJ
LLQVPGRQVAQLRVEIGAAVPLLAHLEQGQRTRSTYADSSPGPALLAERPLRSELGEPRLTGHRSAPALATRPAEPSPKENQPADSELAESPPAEPPTPPLTLASLFESLPGGQPGTATLTHPAGASVEQARFILAAAEAAQASQRATGVPASVTIAQAILESDWGRSRLSAENQNYFGIKGSSRPGTAGIVAYETWEVEGGRNVMRREPFRAYRSMADSFTDHGRFFHENSRYGRALEVRHDARQFAQEISRAGYATDPAYPDKLIRLMDRFNLYAYDLFDTSPQS